MTDKEVGELWAAEHPEHQHEMCCDIIRGLIRKLVEERSWSCRARCAHAAHDRAENAGGACNHTLDALHDFGIDPASFKR